MPDDHDALYALYRQDFHLFAQKAFETVNPNATFQDNWHLHLLSWTLMKCANGEIRRLIVCLPPRSLKSFMFSVAFPAWMLGHNPALRFIYVSHSDELSRAHMRDFRRIIQAPWYRRTFPKMRPALKKDTEHEIVTSENGFRFATSIGGTLTGRGGDFIFLDDPIQASDAQSYALRTHVNEWITTTAYSRFDDPNTGVFGIVTQRTHVDDPVGFALERGKWEVISIPAIAEKSERIQIGENEVYTREAGEALHPARMSLELLNEMRDAIGSYNFAAQYQQNPVPPEGNLLKGTWLKSYEKRPARDAFEQIIQSWDTASETGEGRSFSVCLTFGVRENRYYLLDVVRDRLDFPTLKAKVVRHARTWGADHILIEKASSGRALLQVLLQETRLPLIPVSVDVDKVTRVARVSAYIEAGRVFLPNDAPWLATFMQEVLAFPHVTFDDQVDALAQFLLWIQDRNARPKSRFYAIGGRSGDRYYDRTGIPIF